jgi:hypothetical protein
MPTTYAIPDGRTVMAATTYTGNGSTQTISNAVNGVSFQPDWVWTKRRSTGRDHALYDSVRGAQKWLSSNLTDAELSGIQGVLAFNSNGFNLGADGDSNASGSTYIGWQWKAGGTAVSNTAGTITSSVSANTTAGFSVVTYTGNGTSGATVGHGLGVAPSMIIAKPRAGGGWPVYHSSMAASPQNGFLILNTTSAFATDSGMWNNTAPSSTVITLGNGGSTNTSSGTYVAYCFAAVAGYSAFGSYTGNGSSDGVFIYTGFQPRFIMVKQSSAAGEDWLIQDTSRKPYNTGTTGVSLAADTSGAEVNSSAQLWDVLSNGFKLRASGGGINASGATYIYAAFASNPTKYANAF